MCCNRSACSGELSLARYVRETGWVHTKQREREKAYRWGNKQNKKDGVEERQLLISWGKKRMGGKIHDGVELTLSGWSGVISVWCDPHGVSGSLQTRRGWGACVCVCVDAEMCLADEDPRGTTHTRTSFWVSRKVGSSESGCTPGLEPICHIEEKVTLEWSPPQTMSPWAQWAQSVMSYWWVKPPLASHSQTVVVHMPPSYTDQPAPLDADDGEIRRAQLWSCALHHYHTLYVCVCSCTSILVRTLARKWCKEDDPVWQKVGLAPAGPPVTLNRSRTDNGWIDG